MPNLTLPGFKFIKRLGTGGFASTYLCKDLYQKFGDVIAVKIPHDKEKEVALVGGDVPALATLRGIPYIVEYLEIMCIEGRYVLIMEYVKGALLREILGKPGTGVKLAMEKALSYAMHVAKGLKAAHTRKMVHRDIKPENIIIDENTDRAKILDFGIASAIGSSGGFKTSMRRHTPAYTPYEVLYEGKGDHRVDIYALGVTLFEMLAGDLPYSRGRMLRPREVNPKIPLYIEKIILKAIAADQEKRFQNIEEFIRALEPPMELEHARETISAGAFRKAEYILRSFIQKDPDDTRGYEALANLLSRCHRNEEAREYLTRLIALDPENANYHLRMGVTLMSLGQDSEATHYFKKADMLATDSRTKKQIARLLSKQEK